MKEREPTVYLLASARNGTLYVGVTAHLVQRIWQHRNAEIPGFTQRYGVHRLAWFERAETMEAAITREKRIKKWNRAWKLDLIERMNPNWDDLWSVITGANAETPVFPPARE